MKIGKEVKAGTEVSTISYLTYMLALIRQPGLGPAKLGKILRNHLEDTAANDLFSDSLNSSLDPSSPASSRLSLLKLKSLFDTNGQCLLTSGETDWAGVEKDLRWAESEDCHILSFFDPEYPKLLKEIQNAPPLLFVKGDINLLSRPQIAMVGSRNPSPVGRSLAREFAKTFSDLGFTVTSGLALGIDGESHQAALKGKGSTVAVLGSSLDHIYPPSHQSLAAEIVKFGALVSEFPIDTPPKPSHFPRRNRIISGLSLGTLVVEAALGSGSLITARIAIEQGREVFAMPGTIYNSLAKGCHALIREGAKLVETPEDVLEELGALLNFVGRSSNSGSNSSCKSSQGNHRPSKLDVLDVEGFARKSVVKKKQVNCVNSSLFQPMEGLREPLESSIFETGLDIQEENLLEFVDLSCTPIDVVIIRSGLTAAKVSSMLLTLELKGRVASVPGGVVRVIRGERGQ